MPVTVIRPQRDALYKEALTDLTALGDLYTALDQGRADEARGLWERFWWRAAVAGADRLGPLD